MCTLYVGMFAFSFKIQKEKKEKKEKEKNSRIGHTESMECTEA